jgi:hypothetical protein
VRVSKLAFVKDHKLYRAIAGSKCPHGAEILSGTWEAFCGLLGRSDGVNHNGTERFP